jgi:hypothetical protein
MSLLRSLPRPVRRLLPLLLLLLVASKIGFCSRHSGQYGQRFAALAELKEQQRESGYVWIGNFGKDWPARVVEITTSRDQISFTRKNGTRHSYTGFAGYTLKMIRLQGRDEEVIVVFRSTPEAPLDRNNVPAHNSESPVRIL